MHAPDSPTVRARAYLGAQTLAAIDRAAGLDADAASLHRRAHRALSARWPRREDGPDQAATIRSIVRPSPWHLSREEAA